MRHVIHAVNNLWVQVITAIEDTRPGAKFQTASRVKTPKDGIKRRAYDILFDMKSCGFNPSFLLLVEQLYAIKYGLIRSQALMQFSQIFWWFDLFNSRCFQLSFQQGNAFISSGHISRTAYVTDFLVRNRHQTIDSFFATVGWTSENEYILWHCLCRQTTEYIGGHFSDVVLKDRKMLVFI